MANFKLKDASGLTLLDLSKNLCLLKEEMKFTLPVNSAMPVYIRDLDLASNIQRYWASVAHGALTYGNGVNTSSLSNGIACVIATKSILANSGMTELINASKSLSDFRCYLIVFDCRDSYGTSFIQQISLYLGMC